MLNGWWFLSSGGAYPLVFMVGVKKGTARSKLVYRNPRSA